MHFFRTRGARLAAVSAAAAGAGLASRGALSETDLKPKRQRNLWTLPKAQLHLHLGPACIPRNMLEDLIATNSFEEQKTKAHTEASELIASAEAVGRTCFAMKYRRRLSYLLSSDILSAAFGPRTTGFSESEELAEIKRMDEEIKQPGAARVWDQQWLARQMLKAGGQDGEMRLLRTLYEDAAAEGIHWIEVCTGLKVRDGTVDSKDAAEWQARLAVWRELEKAYADRQVHLRFVVNCPETTLDVQALVAFLKEVDGGEAVVGVGQWGTETSTVPKREAYTKCRELGLHAVNVHAGEHVLQAACPDGAEVNTSVLASYDGPRHVHEAMEMGARRVGHGIEAIKDPILLEALAQHGVCLEICLLSNRRLGYCEEGLAAHPLPKLMAAGVPCCLASDDPTFFGSASAHGLVREFIIARHILKFDDEQLAELARASFRHSCAPEAVRERGLKAIDAWLSQNEAS